MTFLRWAGSKKQIIETLASCWHAAQCGRRTDGRYIEAFSGSAALFFRLAPTSALLIDVNSDLQHCLSRVQAAPRKVAAALKNFTCSESEYYRVRSQVRSEFTADEWAARFIYLNRNCFNGLYRTNRSGQFNVPFGGSRSGQLPAAARLIEASQMLKGAELITGDFYDVLAPRVRKNDFVYLDPPYAQRNVNLDNQYGPDVFGTQDLDRLDELASLVNSRGGQFLISYADCSEIQFIAKKWAAHRVTVRRTIAANHASRRPVEELLISNI